MSEVRIRKRCEWCEPPHMMDDLGEVLPGDQIRDAFCEVAQAKALGYVNDLGVKEQQALKGKLYTPADVAGLIEVLGQDYEEDGVKKGTMTPALIVLSCLALGVGILAAAVIWGLIR